MKLFLKILSLFFVVYVFATSCKSIPLSQRSKEFIILKNGDTLKADKLRAVNPFRNIGRVTLVNFVDGEEVETVYTYDQIYQIHYVDRKNRKSVEEIIEETPSRLDTHVGMDIIINKGNVKLYLNDPGFRPDYPFVVSEFYHGYVNSNSKRKELLQELDKCEAFRTQFTEKKQRSEKNLETMIRFYNENCE